MGLELIMIGMLSAEFGYWVSQNGKKFTILAPRQEIALQKNPAFAATALKDSAKCPYFP
jgi:hypothetical protein